jgi:hypothetical protein
MTDQERLPNNGCPDDPNKNNPTPSETTETEKTGHYQNGIPDNMPPSPEGYSW